MRRQPRLLPPPRRGRFVVARREIAVRGGVADALQQRPEHALGALDVRPALLVDALPFPPAGTGMKKDPASKLVGHAPFSGAGDGATCIVLPRASVRRSAAVRAPHLSFEPNQLYKPTGFLGEALEAGGLPRADRGFGVSEDHVVETPRTYNRAVSHPLCTRRACRTSGTNGWLQWTGRVPYASIPNRPFRF